MGFRQIQVHLRDDIDVALGMVKFQYLTQAFGDYEELVELIEHLWLTETIEELTGIRVEHHYSSHFINVLHGVLRFLDRDHLLRKRIARYITPRKFHETISLHIKPTGLYLYS
jgi:hypothetical protein